MKPQLLLLLTSLAACATNLDDTSTDEADVVCQPGNPLCDVEGGGGGGGTSNPLQISVGAYSSTGLDVSWTGGAANARSWKLYRSIAVDLQCHRAISPTSYALIGSWTADPGGYTADRTGLVQDVEYCYRIDVTNASNNTTSSSTCTTNASGTAQGLYATVNTTGVFVEWRDIYLGEDSSTVKRIGPGGATVALDTEPADFAITCHGNFYQDNGLVPNTAYRYQLWTHAHTGDQLMEERTVTTLPGPPLAPSIVSVSSTATTATMAYSDRSIGEDYFRVERCLNGTCVVVATQLGRSGTGSISSFTDGPLAPSTYYLYRITAVNAAGQGAVTQGVTTASSRPNLYGTVTSGPAGLLAGQRSVAITRVCNYGGGSASGSFQVLTVLKRGTVVVAQNTQSVPSLGYGACYDVPVTSDPLIAGSYQWTAYVDSGYAVPEANENDNTSTTLFTVAAP